MYVFCRGLLDCEEGVCGLCVCCTLSSPGVANSSISRSEGTGLKCTDNKHCVSIHNHQQIPRELKLFIHAQGILQSHG